ncbi:acyl-CoA dehydrogenase [Amycolatopsis sp. K13G38]|uniref:Acyl-CoA dehydrogenase n=1 Tax=Amycolatopsis acididurans TaxID=2724524 RepID=A0ABX1JEV9_9PSEU|nr:acyl-CoA dehydrogenase family protein [Amycolatopsis acididurans]NKQ57046.1 acyl-CoA dehydrogenase [Amycolatopsis acididurans]
MDSGEKALLAESLEGIVRNAAPERLDDALTEFGWRELLEEEPHAAVSILLELQGRGLARSSALDISCTTATGLGGMAAVVFPALAHAGPTSAATVDGSAMTVEVRGIVAVRAEAPDRVVVPAVLDGATVVVQAPWQGSWPGSGTGIAPEAGWVKLDTTLHADSSTVTTDAACWRNLRAAGHRALAHELTGLAGAMLELAVDHVGSRVQFGRTLGGFQAVKHKLADVRLWQECAKLAADAAWEAAGEHERAIAAAIAKVTANRFSEAARQHCQQVLGGMGFTWEHDFHRYLKRAMVLEPFLGTTTALNAELGRELRAGTLPRLAML